MKSEYLNGITIRNSSFSQVVIAGNGMDTWYAASYGHIKTNPAIKRDIVKLTNAALGINTITRDWEWHHVVETQHMSQFILSDLNLEEMRNMPTVLISKKEHALISQNFNNGAFRELSTISIGRKSVPTQSRMHDNAEKERRRAIIKNLKMMYDNAYVRFPTFKKIARNVFEHHMRSFL